MTTDYAKQAAAEAITAEIIKQAAISKMQCKAGSLENHTEQSHLLWLQNFERCTSMMTTELLIAKRQALAELVAANLKFCFEV